MSDMAMFRIGSDNVVTFTMSGISRTLTGPEEALQLVAAALYQDVGSNVFSPQDGGSALADLVRGNIPSDDTLKARAAMVVRRTMDTVKSNQKPGRSLDSTVTGLDLIEATANREAGSILLKIRIRLADGSTFAAIFPSQGVT